MKKILLVLTLLALVITACTQTVDEAEITGDNTADSLPDDFSDIDNLNSELEEIEDLDLDLLNF